jgi:transcriptional regulator with XRE-family HTH domain
MKSGRQLRLNMDAMLKARGQTRTQLAAACGLSRSWASKVWKESPDPQDTRGIPMKSLDAVADFFGVSVYNLFQPGISHLTERRAGADRRSVVDRRVSVLPRGLPVTPIRQISVTPEDEAVLADLHALSYDQYQRVKGWITVARLADGSARRTGPRVALPPGGPSGSSPPPPTAAPKKKPPK